MAVAHRSAGALLLIAGTALAAPAPDLKPTCKCSKGLGDKQYNGCRGPRVVIVGAGVAGVGAATRLLEHGISDVTVLESSNRIGGRIHYVKIGKRGVDLGAHWVHGEEGNIVYDLASPLHLVDHSGDFDKEVYLFRPDGTLLPLEDSEPYTELLFSDTFGHLLTGRETNSTNLYDVVTQRFKELNLEASEEDKTALLKTLTMYHCTTLGCGDLRQVSATAAGRYTEPPGDSAIMWLNQGYNNVFPLITRNESLLGDGQHPVRKRVKLNKEVVRVDWSNRELGVWCSDGSYWPSDVVILTPSIGVLKRMHPFLFHPGLPILKTKAIQGLGIDVVDKVYLIFDEPWWPKNTTGFVPLKYNKDDVKGWQDHIIMVTTEASNPNALGAWVVGRGARSMEKTSDKEVISSYMEVLHQYLGQAYNITPPVAFIRSKWGQHNFYGSYSYPSALEGSQPNLRQDLIQPLVNKYGKMVLFAGEATNLHHFGTVNGALETGWREADRVLDSC